MLIDTYAYGRIELPVQQLYGKILVILSDLDVRRTDGEQDLVREGDLMMPRWARGTKVTRYVHYRSIFDLSRACVYMLDGWGSFEEGELGQVMDDLEHTSFIMNRLIGYGTLSRTVKKHLERKLSELSLSLHGKSDPDKAWARKMVKRAEGFMDALGRVNPQANRMRLSSATSRLKARCEKVQSMRPAIVRRGEILQNEFDSAANVLWKVRNSLGEMITNELLRKGAVSASDNAALRRDLLELKDEMRSLRVQPFVSLRAYTSSDLERAAGMLYRRLYADAIITMTNAYNGVRSKLAAIWLEPLHITLGLLAREVEAANSPHRGEGARERAVRYRHNTSELITNLEKFHDQLGMLDDTKFVRPVFKEARTKINLAKDQLGAGFLKEAKDTVKKVVDIL